MESLHKLLCPSRYGLRSRALCAPQYNGVGKCRDSVAEDLECTHFNSATHQVRLTNRTTPSDDNVDFETLHRGLLQDTAAFP